MSISAVSAQPGLSASSRASPAAAQNVNARAADGDYKLANAKSSHIKDSDGDYKPLASSPTAQSSQAVQTALSALKAGG